MATKSTRQWAAPLPAKVHSLAAAMEPVVRSQVETGLPTPSLFEAAARVLLVADQPVRAAFLARALNALARLAPGLAERQLGNAAGAPSDYAALLSVLEDPAALDILRGNDLLATARLRGLDARTKLLEAAGGTLTVGEVGKLLGITRQAIEKRRRGGRLLAFRTGRRGYAYPAWQFSPAGGVLPGLEFILAELRGHDPWMQATFFLNANTWLGGESPLAELQRGHVEEVKRAARAYGEQGAA